MASERGNEQIGSDARALYDRGLAESHRGMVASMQTLAAARDASSTRQDVLFGAQHRHCGRRIAIRRNDRRRLDLECGFACASRQGQGRLEHADMTVILPPRDLQIGATYSYGIRVSRLSGSTATGDIVNGICSSQVTLQNRNPTTSALDADD
jgi:hypothetical protein